MAQNNGIKYDIMTTEQCPLCEEGIQVGTAGPRGLAQHQGKKKCLATVKKKQQDAAMAKKPTLLSYLRWQDTTLPTTTHLAKEAERKEAESSSRVVVSQVAMPPPVTYADKDAQGQGEDAGPSADRDLDLDLDLNLDRAWDQDESFAWSTVKVRARVRGCEPGCEPWARGSTPSLAPNDAQNGTLDRTLHEIDNAQKPKQKPQATPARKGCRDAWLLLDHLHARIGKLPHEVLEDKGGDELLYELSGYNRSAALSICTDVPRDELWENINPGLDRILGFGRPQGEIVAMVRCGRVGLQGLYEYLEALIEEGGVVGGLLDGKVTALIMAIEE